VLYICGMCKQFLFIFLFGYVGGSFGQKVQNLPMPKIQKVDDKKITDSAYKYFELGLKAFNGKKYKRADSIYTISLSIKQHPFTFYNRALAKAMMKDNEGYCEDICAAATRGDKECDTIFRKDCGSADTIYVHLDNKPATRLKHEAFCVIYQSEFKNANVAVKFDKKGKFLSVENFEAPNAGKIPMEQTFPEFDGGKGDVKAFVKANLKIPPQAKNLIISGKLVVKFAVNRLGYPENIRIVMPLENCPECSKEAVRLVSSMPRWKPGALNGKTAKFNYNLPLDFVNVAK